jgi:hypothetical protein
MGLLEGGQKEGSALLAVLLLGFQSGKMLVAKSATDPQLSDDAERVDGFVRTIRPITQVCVEDFLVTLTVCDASLDGDLWHVSIESLSLVSLLRALDLVRPVNNARCKKCSAAAVRQVPAGSRIEAEPVAAVPGRFGQLL